MKFSEKEKLAEDPNTPEDILRELAKDKDEDWWVRAYVASNPNTPDDVLRALAKDKEWAVRGLVASNPNTFEDTLLYLATDINNGVRVNVAKNPKASSKLLIMQFEYEKSLRKPSEFVIRALYVNPKLPAFAKRVIETLFGEMLP